MPNCLEANLSALRKIGTEKSVLRAIQSDKAAHSEYRYELSASASGQPNMRIAKIDATGQLSERYYLHSHYDPYKSEQRFVDSIYSESVGVFYLYGFGFGYHVELLLERLKSGQRVVVIEANLDVLRHAFEQRDLTALLNQSALTVLVLVKETSKQLIDVLTAESGALHVHSTSLKNIPEAFSDIKALFENNRMMRHNISKFKPLLEANLKANATVQAEPITRYFLKHPNPIVIVSAGPSLNANSHLLRQFMGRSTIISVGSALRPLMTAGVTPDYFCIIDPQDLTYQQIKGYEDLSIPLLFMDTASHHTVSSYRGRKIVFTSDAQRAPEESERIDSNGSVATAVLDIAIKFGGNPIVFVGQDLAFVDHQHHAVGDMYGEAQTVKDLPTLKQVEGFDGERLATSSSLLYFKHMIEQKIERTKDVVFINSTFKGAYIKGCLHIPLEDVYKQYINK